jgi:hypothetical protein
MPGQNREEKIRARAHELWELEGRPEGADERHWLQAAAEVDAAPKKPSASKAPAKKAAAPKVSAAKTDASKKTAAAKAPAAKKPTAKK